MGRAAGCNPPGGVFFCIAGAQGGSVLGGGRIEPAFSGRSQHTGQLVKRHLRQLANVQTGKRHRQRLRLEPFPRHSGHRLPVMKRDTRFFISALWLLAKVCSTYRRAPVKVPW